MAESTRDGEEDVWSPYITVRLVEGRGTFLRPVGGYAIGGEEVDRARVTNNYIFDVWSKCGVIVLIHGM